MNLAEPRFDPSSFSHNRQRLMKRSAPQKFLERVVEVAMDDGFMSGEPLSIDGSLIEAWLSS